MRDYTLQRAQASVSPGWSELIYEFYMARQFSEFIRATQIKEKFGGLRIYVDHGSEHVWDVINELENRSLKTCETCGRPGKVRPTGWIMTLCWRHYATILLRNKYVRRHLREAIKRRFQ